MRTRVRLTPPYRFTIRSPYILAGGEGGKLVSVVYFIYQMWSLADSVPLLNGETASITFCPRAACDAALK